MCSKSDISARARGILILGYPYSIYLIFLSGAYAYAYTPARIDATRSFFSREKADAAADAAARLAVKGKEFYRLFRIKFFNN